MKKLLLIVSSVFILATLLTLNVNLDVINDKVHLTSKEDVKAIYGWEMNTVSCDPRPGTYNRCQSVFYSSDCDVHAQTFCPKPE